MKTTTIKTTIKSLVIAGAIIGSSAMASGALYSKCAGCHGMSGEKAALGKSKIIADMSEADLNTAMNGYKDGTYGGAMKGLMKGQVMKLNKGEISSLSTYIAGLK